MDPRYLSRLQEEQIKAISETDDKIEQINKFKDDYRALQDRLKTLPDKVTHNVMVPFGKLAFMPGQLVHTNEILVLLGDNWFVDRSAKQAAEIAGRRIKELDKTLNDLKAQQKLLTPRFGFTSELQSEIQGHGDVKEIVEEYEEVKEKLWDEQHRKSVKRYHEELKRNLESKSEQQKKEDDKLKKEDSLWSRLDELERQEAERGEMNNSSSDDEDGEENKNNHSQVHSEKSTFTDRKVNWEDEMKDDKYSAEKDDDDDSTDEDEDTETVVKPVKKVITFTHSSGPPVQLLQAPKTEESAIQSPADIYRLFSPKSILKKTSDNISLSNSQEITNSNSEIESKNSCDIVPDKDKILDSSLDIKNKTQSLYQLASQNSSSNSSMHKAFTGLVVEKSDLLTTTFPTVEGTQTAPVSTTDEPTKRVSKFKASRSH